VTDKFMRDDREMSRWQQSFPNGDERDSHHEIVRDFAMHL